MQCLAHLSVVISRGLQTAQRVSENIEKYSEEDVQIEGTTSPDRHSLRPDNPNCFVKVVGNNFVNASKDANQ